MNQLTDNLISRTVLIDELMAGCMPLDLPGLSGVTGDESTLRNYIDSIPSVDAMPVVHGAWEVLGDCGITRCLACKWNFEGCIDYKYCPHCGAKMDGERRDT